MGTKGHGNPTTAALMALLAACAGTTPTTAPATPAAPRDRAPLLESQRRSLADEPALAPALAPVPGTTVTITVGQPLRLHNHDGVCHAWFSASAPHTSALGTLRPGEGTTVVFDQPGTVQLYCSLHPGERITVHVTPAP